MAVTEDPLYRMRHALAGVALALAVSVPAAAFVGGLLGDWFGGVSGSADGDNYHARVAVYGALLLYVLAGAVVLFMRVARHETRRLTALRVLLWLASLWLWPVLLAATGPVKPKR